MKEGRGKYTHSNGSVYDEYWKDGREDGRGKLTHSNDDVYDGDWKKGCQVPAMKI
jgi:hypothetical protein